MVRYVHLPAAAVDTALLEDATRRGEFVDGVEQGATDQRAPTEAEQQAIKSR